MIFELLHHGVLNTGLDIMQAMVAYNIGITSPLLWGDLRVGFALKCASENLKSGPEPYSRYKMNSKRSKYETWRIEWINEF